MEDQQDVFIPPPRKEGVMPLDDLKARMRCVQETKDLMVLDVHYGTIPGTPKPSLWKPGAELLCQRFQLYPTYEERIDDLGNDHIRAVVKCRLFHIVTGKQEGESVSVCTTKEKKYRYANAERVCPQCSKPTIIKGKAEYGGGYICFAKKGGCGAKFKDGDRAIEGQTLGQVENPDLADKWNTIVGMATKRSLVSATLVATAASEFFTQDDDSDQRHHEDEKPAAEEKPLRTQPKPEERPQQEQEHPTQPQLETLTGVIKDIVTAKGVSRLHLALPNNGQREFMFRTPPLGMPAMDVGSHWNSLFGKTCTAHYEKARGNNSDTVYLILKKIEFPQQTKEDSRRSFDAMRAKYDNRPASTGLLDDNQKRTLLQEVANSSLTEEDFKAFCIAIYQCEIDKLPADKYAEVREHLVSGFATAWCFDNGPTAPGQKVAS